MSEDTLLEIIGIASQSKWSNIQKFIQFVLHHTLDENEAGYELTIEQANHGENVRHHASQGYGRRKTQQDEPRGDGHGYDEKPHEEEKRGIH